MTVASGLLMVLEQAPPATASSLVLSMVDTPNTSFDRIFATDPAPAAARWDSIMIHHSGQSVGNAESIGQLHETLGYGGLGYHFVIGNGNGTGDGDIQAGARWMRQMDGVYARGAVSIALVGNGDDAGPTPAQQASLIRLTNALQKQLNVGAHRVYLHREVADTTSPGRLFPAGRFRQSLLAIPNN